jgi:hypothetical protein
MRMVALVLATCAAATAWGQQVPAPKPSVPDVLAKLHSKHWSERTDALDEIGSDQLLLHTEKIQAALVDLLKQEVAEDTTSQNTSAITAEDDGEEEYSQYFTSLSYIVSKFVNWNDPNRACMMVNAAYVDYPSSASEAAARARAVVPCLLKRSQSNRATDREIASPMLAEAVEKAQGTLNAQAAQIAKHVILSDLRDPDVGVRSATVHALRKFGGTDMIPALEDVAAKDPAPEVDGHSIRKSAAEAIAEIQKRTGLQQK